MNPDDDGERDWTEATALAAPALLGAAAGLILGWTYVPYGLAITGRYSYEFASEDRFQGSFAPSAASCSSVKNFRSAGVSIERG